MLARAIALASVFGDDAAPIARLPAPFARAAEAARERLMALPRAARSTAVARETMALFTVPAPAFARRVLPRGLRAALAPPEPSALAALGTPPAWLLRALDSGAALGVCALARASSTDGSGEQTGVVLPAVAELLRRLAPDEGAQLVTARRRAGRLGADFAADRTVVGLALAFGDEVVESLARRTGLYRIAWAASLEPEAQTWLSDTLTEPERVLATAAGHALWFAGSEHAAEERARIEADLEETG